MLPITSFCGVVDPYCEVEGRFVMQRTRYYPGLLYHSFCRVVLHHSRKNGSLYEIWRYVPHGPGLGPGLGLGPTHDMWPWAIQWLLWYFFSMHDSIRIYLSSKVIQKLIRIVEYCPKSNPVLSNN
jgi:hypothetical protein